MKRLLFTYGSLRRGYTSRAARLLHKQGVYVADAHIRAAVDRTGKWPVIRRGHGSVSGEVFEIPTRILGILNMYEGPAYRLRRTVARTNDGSKLPVFAYWAGSN